MNRIASPGRRGAAAALLLAAWALALALVYLWPAGGSGVRAVFDGSLPDPALTREPVRRLGSIAAAVAVFLAAWGYGSALVGLGRRRRLAPGRGGPLEELLLALGAGVAALYAVALALSAVHLLKPPALVAVTVAGVALALARVPRRLPRRPRPPTGVIEWAALALVAGAGVFALIGALAPEVEYDALWYHLELIKRYLADGTLLDFPCQYVSHYPMGAELMFGYGLGLADQVAAKLVHFGFGVLFVLATYRLGTQVGSRRVALLAAAIVAVTPTVTWEATTAYVELGTAFFVTLALTWVIRYAGERSGATLAAAALFAGLGLATKTLAAIALVPLAILVVLVTRAGAARRLLTGGAFVAAALVPALPWFVKAQLETGNPLFPNAYGVFGADPEVWTAQADAAQHAFYDKFGYRDGFGSFIALPWDVTMHGAAFGGCIGVAYLVLLPLALLRRPSRPLVLTALFCVGYVVLWASPLSSLQMRFVVPVLGALAVVAAVGFEAAWELARERVPAAAVVFAGVVLATLALALPPFVGLHDRDGEGTLTHVVRETPLDVVSGAEGEGAYIGRRVPAYPAILRLNQLAGPGDRAVMAIDPFANYYARPELVPDYAVCLGNAGLYDGKPGSPQRALTAIGADYLLVDENTRAGWSFDWLEPHLRRTALDPVYSNGGVRLFRIRPASQASLHARSPSAARPRSRTRSAYRTRSGAANAGASRRPARPRSGAARDLLACASPVPSARPGPASAATPPTGAPGLPPAAG